MSKGYNALRSTVRLFTKPMEAVWAEPFDGAPAVFCPNHAGALGPIDMVVHFPMCDQMHPWLNAAVMDPKLVPAYVRQDYWWRPGCKLEPLFNATLPYMAAAVLPPILRTVPGVPVYHDMQVIKTFRKSVDYLRQGEHLVIFPQQPSGYKSHHMWINKGFLQIAPMAWRTLGLALKFYPVHIDHKNHLFTIAAPVQYDPDVPLKEQEQHLLDVIAEGLKG